MNHLFYLMVFLILVFVDCKDYYTILGVEKTDSTATIKKAFRNLAMKYHPGKIFKKNNIKFFFLTYFIFR